MISNDLHRLLWAAFLNGFACGCERNASPKARQLDLFG